MRKAFCEKLLRRLLLGMLYAVGDFGFKFQRCRLRHEQKGCPGWTWHPPQPSKGSGADALTCSKFFIWVLGLVACSISGFERKTQEQVSNKPS